MNWKNFPILILISILAACAGHAPKPHSSNDRARLQYEMGVGYLNKGKLKQALDALREADRLNPNQPDIQEALGLVYFGLGVYESAKVNLEAAQKNNPNDAMLANNLASLYLAINKPELAIKESSLALKAPDYRTPAAAYYNRGVAHSMLKQDDLAIKDFTNAIQLEPMFDKPYIDLARIYIRNGKYARALPYLNSAVKINPKNVRARLTRGIARWNRGLVTDAEEDFRMVLRLAPPDSTLARAANDWLRRID